ncbi:hypothetical protein KY285_000083 [Solanum tuberosum]|nr:hypothetical protein KY284_003826 [Solanum tuberosum]KAH0764212.1 hypothetical protein KY285_000083 [Solanum tuberosum]
MSSLRIRRERNKIFFVALKHICPLGVSSWNHIKEEKLNHMWAVVKDKFDSDDMNSHRDHASSNRNAINRAKLKMLHHIGSKTIREIIYQKAQIQELVEYEPSLSSIEIVEKCFGPQSHSHVFGIGGGVKARDLKGGTSSKAELLAKLRSTQKENQSLKDCMSNFQNEMKELKHLKEFFLAQHPNFQLPIQVNDYSDT